MIPLFWFSCAPPPAPPSATALAGGVEVVAGEPLDRVVVLDASGSPVATRRLPQPLDTVLVPLAWSPGDVYTVDISAGDQHWTVPVSVPTQAGPVSLRLQAPLGQADQAVSDGETVPLLVVEGSNLSVGLVATAREPATLVLEVGGQRQQRTLTAPGERAVFTWKLGQESAGQPVPVSLTAVGEEGAETTRLLLKPDAISRAEAAGRLRLVAVAFPADPSGSVDLARPPGRITLPAAWWSRLLRWSRLGFRPADPTVPWAWQGLTLENQGKVPMNAVVRARMLDAADQVDPAFRPRLREADDGTGAVSALLRIPAGSTATASLPVFVDTRILGDGPWTAELTVTPLGSATPLHVSRTPVYVSRGSTLASAGLGVAVAASLSGLGLLLRRTRRWLGEAQTSELMTISLFGALSFGVSAATQLVGLGLAAMLGPFSGLLTGLLDDALRTALWATLLTLLPRPGTAGLAVCVGTLLRTLVFGSMGPVDLLFMGGHIAWLELCLWAVGITRSGAWRQGSRRARGLRLGVGFGLASTLSMAGGLVLSAVFYRMYYAGWYVAMLLVFPGFVYSLLASWLSLGFTDGLRRVEP